MSYLVKVRLSNRLRDRASCDPHDDLMEMDLAGKVVAVLGAASGIGCAIAKGFIKEGCQVRGFDR